MYRRSSAINAGTPDEANRGNVPSSSRTYVKLSVTESQRNTLSPGFKATRATCLPSASRTTTSAVSSKFQRKTFVVKDTRDYSSEALREIAKSLAEFLSSVKVNISEENILNPKSKRDFEHIFEAIWKFFEPDYKYASTEEFQKILRSLGYPFPLKDSTMKTMTAPQYWKQILRALDWLRQLALYARSFDSSSLFENCRTQRSPFFPSGSLNFNIFKSNVNCFLLASGGNNNFEPVEEEFRRTLRELNMNDADFDELVTENTKLEQELEEIKARLLECNKLPDEINALDLDLKKMTDYYNDVENYRNNTLLPVIESSKRDNLELEKEIQQLKLEIEKNDAIVKEQNISPEEVKELMLAKEKVNMELNVQNEEKELLEKAFYDAQLQICNQGAKITAKFADLIKKSKLLIQHKDLGIDQSFVDYLDVSLSATDPELMKFCKETIRPGLDLAQESSTKLLLEVESEIRCYKETQENIEESIAAADQELAELEAHKQELDRKISESKINNNPTLAAKKVELDRLKEVYDEYERSAGMEVMSKKEHLEVLQNEFDSKKKRYKREADEMFECLKSMLNMLIQSEKMYQDLKTSQDRAVSELINSVQAKEDV